MIAAGMRCKTTSAPMVAAFPPEMSGGTSEITVSATAVRTKSTAGRSLHRRNAAAMATPTSEKTPVTTANPGSGIASPRRPSG